MTSFAMYWYIYGQIDVFVVFNANTDKRNRDYHDSLVYNNRNITNSILPIPSTLLSLVYGYH